jgi:hypothetical protein
MSARLSIINTSARTGKLKPSLRTIPSSSVAYEKTYCQFIDYSLLKIGRVPSLIIFSMYSSCFSIEVSKQVQSPKSTQLVFEQLPQQLDFIPISPCLSISFVSASNLNRSELHFSQKDILVIECPIQNCS